MKIKQLLTVSGLVVAVSVAAVLAATGLAGSDMPQADSPASVVQAASTSSSTMPLAPTTPASSSLASSTAPTAIMPALESPVPNTVTLDRGSLMTIFNRFTIPSVESWSGAMGDPGSVEAFVDTMRTCASGRNCRPYILFYNLDTSRRGDATYLPELLNKRELQGCPGNNSTQHALEGPLNLMIAEAPVRYYRVRCGMDPHAGSNRYVWFFPTKDLMVASTVGEGGGISVSIAQGVLEGIKWL